VFDQILYSLQKDAEAIVKELRPHNGDFRPPRDAQLYYPHSSVAYDKKLRRIAVQIRCNSCRNE